MSDDIATQSFPIPHFTNGESITHAYPGYWFNTQPWYLQLPGVLVVILMAWILQRYYQDGLVASLFAKAMAYVTVRMQSSRRARGESNSGMRYAPVNSPVQAPILLPIQSSDELVSQATSGYDLVSQGM